MISERNDDTVLGDFVLVRWLDASFDLDSPPEPVAMETVGWITDTNAEWLTVAQERDTDATFHRAHTSILRVNLIEIARLQQVRE